MYVILVYDISMDRNGTRTLSRVFKTCKKYLNHVQLSVFEGEITPAQLIQLKAELNHFIRDDLDTVIIFKNANKNWLKKEYLGIDVSERTSNFF
ncbi:CRISPR-associated endonuclease Cas2 [Lactobacillus selangorensis]|uniref:CRISPR-associated endonuclease Cas2 n=1 Tax=Lactobacillus selangorensis TaxID=81857 RepID=UPI00070E8011|nr:CRISPR-associated endonuclease Cas2 [Lactobacillus selangorensis]